MGRPPLAIPLNGILGMAKRAQHSAPPMCSQTQACIKLVLTAFGTEGQQHTDAISVSIQHPPTENPPVISAPILATDDSVWALFPENGTLSHLDLTGQLRQEWAICSSPQQMAFSEGIIGVSLPESGQPCAASH